MQTRIVMVRSVRDALWQQFKAKALQQRLTLGQALDIALRLYLAKK